MFDDFDLFVTCEEYYNDDNFIEDESDLEIFFDQD